MTMRSDASCYSMCGTLKNLQCSMTMSADQRLKWSAYPVMVTSPYQWNDFVGDENQNN